jgi:predicted AlkP superfamily phosphohydrolase/phosphomutase
MPKTILIGLDGVPHSLIEKYTNNGIMPHLACLLEKGRLYRISSTLPEISSVSWATTISGKNPSEHGVYGFTDLAPQSYTMTFPNFSSLKMPPFWKASLSTMDLTKRYAVINVPFTYPAQEINGTHIAGFVALDLEKAIFPKNIYATLQEHGYKIDVDTSYGHESTSLFLRDLDKTLINRISIAKKIWAQEAWDVFMLVFTGTDRLGHFLWDAYLDQDHQYHTEFVDHFKKIDTYIGELASELEPDDTIAFMSDHGFEKLDYEVFINRYLLEWGLLQLRNNPPKSYNDIDTGTVAFCMDPGRIYINRKNLYPRGSVDEEQCAAIQATLCNRFKEITIEGRQVIRKAFPGGDIYGNNPVGRAPDILLLGNEGFDLKGAINAPEFYYKNIFTGKHSYDDTFFALVLPETQTKSYPEVKTIQDVRSALNL